MTWGRGSKWAFNPIFSDIPAHWALSIKTITERKVFLHDRGDFQHNSLKIFTCGANSSSRQKPTEELARKDNDPFMIVPDSQISDSSVTFMDRARTSLFASEGGREQYLKKVLGYDVAQDKRGELLIRRAGSNQKFGYFDDPRFRFSGKEILSDLVADNARDFITSGVSSVQAPLLLTLTAGAVATGGLSVAGSALAGSLGDGLCEAGLQALGFVTQQVHSLNGADLGLAFGFGALGALIPGAGGLLKNRILANLKKHSWGRSLLEQMTIIGEEIAKNLSARLLPLQDKLKNSLNSAFDTIKAFAKDVWEIIAEVIKFAGKSISGFVRNAGECLSVLGETLSHGANPHHIDFALVAGGGGRKKNPSFDVTFPDRKFNSNVIFTKEVEPGVVPRPTANAASRTRDLTQEEKKKFRRDLLLVSEGQRTTLVSVRAHELGVSEKQILAVGAFLKIHADTALREHNITMSSDDLRATYGLLLLQKQREIGSLQDIAVADLQALGDANLTQLSEKLIPALHEYDRLLAGSPKAKTKVTTPQPIPELPTPDPILNARPSSPAASVNYDNSTKLAWNKRQEVFTRDGFAVNPSLADGNILTFSGADPTKVTNMFIRAGSRANNIYAVEGDPAVREAFLNSARVLAQEGKLINFYLGSMEDVVQGKPGLEFTNILGTRVPTPKFTVFDFDFPGFWGNDKRDMIAHAAARYTDPKGALLMTNLLAQRDGSSTKVYKALASWLDDWNSAAEGVDRANSLLRGKAREGSGLSLDIQDREKTILHWTTYFGNYAGSISPWLKDKVCRNGVVDPSALHSLVDEASRLFASKWPILQSSAFITSNIEIKRDSILWNKMLPNEVANLGLDTAINPMILQRLERYYYKSPTSQHKPPFLSVFAQFAPPPLVNADRPLQELRRFSSQVIEAARSAENHGFRLVGPKGEIIVDSLNPGVQRIYSQNINLLNKAELQFLFRRPDGSTSLPVQPIPMKYVFSGIKEKSAKMREIAPLEFFNRQLLVPLIEVKP